MIKHGFVTSDSPEGGLHHEHKKGMRPAPQMVFNKNNSDASIEVGKRSYKLEGDAAEIVKFLADRKDQEFTASTLGDDGKWGPGKDTNNENITIAIGVPTEMKSHQEHIVEAARKGAATLLAKPVVLPAGKVNALVNRDEITYSNPAEKIAGTHSSINPVDDPIDVVKDTLNKGKGFVEEISGKKIEPVTDKIQQLKNKLNDGTTVVGNKVSKLGDKLEKTTEKLPLAGKVISAVREETPSIGQKIAEIGATPITVEINPYLNKKATNLEVHSFKTQAVTFGQIADHISQNILKQKPEKTKHLLPEGDKGPSNAYRSKKGLDLKRFAIPQAQEATKAIVSGMKQIQLSKQTSVLSRKNSKDLSPKRTIQKKGNRR